MCIKLSLLDENAYKTGHVKDLKSYLKTLSSLFYHS